VGRTVSEDELGDTGEVHGDGAEEVVVAGEAGEGVGRDGALELAEGEDGGGVWDEESEQTEERRVGWMMGVSAGRVWWFVGPVHSRDGDGRRLVGKRTEPLRQITATRRRGLEKESLVLLVAQRHGHGSAQGGTVAGGDLLVQLGAHAVLALFDVFHCGRMREKMRVG